MNARLHISELTSEDLGRVVEIENASFPRPWSRSSFEDLMKQSAYTCLGLKELDLLVGYLFFYRVQEEMYIVNVAIDPAFRGRKWATMLMMYAEAWAMKHDVKNMFLEVSAANVPAIKLYEGLDYVRQSRRVKAYDDGTDAILMKKELQAI